MIVLIFTAFCKNINFEAAVSFFLAFYKISIFTPVRTVVIDLLRFVAESGKSNEVFLRFLESAQYFLLL